MITTIQQGSLRIKKKPSLLPQFHSSSNDLIYIFGDENLRMTNTVIIPKHKHKLYAAATTAEPQHLKLDIEFKCLTRPASLLYTPELRWKNK
jgi:hypothetical protein